MAERSPLMARRCCSSSSPGEVPLGLMVGLVTMVSPCEADNFAGRNWNTGLCGRNNGNVRLWLHILYPSCAVNTSLTMSEHHSFVPSGHVCASEKPSPFCPGDGFFSFSEPWSRAMSELDKVQPGVNLLSAFTSTIAVALALGLPMAVAIIWVCS